MLSRLLVVVLTAAGVTGAVALPASADTAPAGRADFALAASASDPGGEPEQARVIYIADEMLDTLISAG